MVPGDELYPSAARFGAPQDLQRKDAVLKLYGHLDEQRDLVDKYKVRDWIREKVGEEYLIPLLGVWDRFDEIDFDKLPDRFVLKTNHGAGWNYIVQDKSKLDKADAKAKFDLWTKLNFTYYQGGLELQYEHIQPKIIAEQFIENDGGDLYDYKLCCFDGEPKVIIYIMNRYVDADERIICFDTDWNVLPFNLFTPLEQPDDIPRPKNLEKMVEVARTLSQGIPFVRVDLYALNDGTIKFGEMTFTTYSGIARGTPRAPTSTWAASFTCPASTTKETPCRKSVSLYPSTSGKNAGRLRREHPCADVPGL